MQYDKDIRPLSNTVPLSLDQRTVRDWYWLVLPFVVFCSRAIFTGTVYFSDGPSHLAAIANRSFIIQPPGYWLFNRFAGLFSDPALAIEIFNWLCSAGGVVVFYAIADAIAGRRLARLGAGLYATTFYVWFSGSIHSTYASQLFFAPLTFYLLLRDAMRPRWQFVAAAAVSFSLGAGLRPSDGLFLLPLFIYCLWARCNRQQALAAGALAGCLCLLWAVPTVLAYSRHEGLHESLEYVQGILTLRSSMLIRGPSIYSAANIVRFVLPLVVGLWAVLLPAMRALSELSSYTHRLLLIWIAPGACFLILIYVGTAPYLNFITAALILAGLSGMARWRYRTAQHLVISCILTNCCLFLFMQPISPRFPASGVINAYVASYTRYALVNRWWVNASTPAKNNSAP